MTIRDEILAFLESHPGDQTTADISAACECSQGAVYTAMSGLTATGEITRVATGIYRLTGGTKAQKAKTKPPARETLAKDAARYRWLRDQMWSQCNTRHFFSLPIRWGLDDNAHAGDSMDAAIDAAQRAGFDPTLTFKGSSNSNQTQAEQTNEPTVWRWKHVKDERWVYGAQPHHLRPDTWSGAQLVGYHIVEPLYAHPPRPAVRLTTHEIHELLIDDTGCERGGVSLARAVESAVLKRNGMEVSDDA